MLVLMVRILGLVFLYNERSAISETLTASSILEENFPWSIE